MGKRPASSKATRGASKGKTPINSGSSNPKTTKFRSQYNSLAVIAKGAPSKKASNKEAIKKVAKDATERRNLLDGLNSINMKDSVEVDGKSKKKKKSSDNLSQGSHVTTASFASVWSNCSNASLNEFFQVWNPKLETHKDALAVIAGLSQIMTKSSSSQTDTEYAGLLFKILSSHQETPTNVLTGALLAFTFVLRKLPAKEIIEHFDRYYSVLRELMEQYHNSKKKSLVKCLIRCFAAITKAHPQGKECIEKGMKKKINIAIRQHKVQDKIKL